MNKVAVIGGGIFGLETAKQLSTSGFEVILFEKNEDLLSEGTAKSVLRLHLGLHYPRDIETANQSIVGYSRFLEHYREFVNLNFENYYGISKLFSKVDKRHFQSFAEEIGIPIAEVPVSNLEKYGFDSKKINAAWRCEEGVIDISKLRNYFEKFLLNNVRVHKSCEVTRIYGKNRKWIVESKDEMVEEFDFIVQATYGTDRIVTPPTINLSRSFEYHKTLTLEVKCKVSNFGVTVIDGDFITVLPKGFGDSLLIYGPEPSVLGRSIGAQFPIEWESKNSFDFEAASAKILARFREWFPKVGEVEVMKTLSTVRSIQPNMQITDRRVSIVKEPAENYFTVWSGKIDHCIEIAETILSRINLKV